MRIRARSPKQVNRWKLFDQPVFLIALHAVYTGILLGLVLSGVYGFILRSQYALWGITITDPNTRSYWYYPTPLLRVTVYSAGSGQNAYVDSVFLAPLPEYVSPFATRRLGMRAATPQESSLWRQYFGPKQAELRSFPRR